MSSRTHHGDQVVSSTQIFRLPPPRHHSTHQVVFNGVVVGVYTMNVYRDHTGPVVILEEAPGSDLPIEFLSLKATEQLLELFGDRRLRVFERHRREHREIWVEVEISERHGTTLRIERAGESGPDKLIDALGKEAFADAFAGRRRRLDAQARAGNQS